MSKVFKQGLLAALEQFHLDNPDLPGMGFERLRLQLEPRLPAPVFRTLLQMLADESVVALQGAWVRLAAHEVRLTPADERSWTRIAPLLAGAERFRPPRARDIAGLLAVAEPDRFLTIDLDRAGIGPQQAQDALQKHRLSGAGTADHHHRLAARDVEVDALQDLLGAERLGDAAKRDFRAHRGKLISGRRKLR